MFSVKNQITCIQNFFKCIAYSFAFRVKKFRTFSDKLPFFGINMTFVCKLIQRVQNSASAPRKTIFLKSEFFRNAVSSPELDNPYIIS